MHWSLAAKSGALALAFLYSPFVFVVLADVLYFVPWFRAREFLAPFMALVVVSSIMPVRLESALVVGVMFYLFLGVKELTLINRARAYEALTLLACFASAFAFFRMFDQWEDTFALLASFMLGAFFFIFDRRSVRQEHRGDAHGAVPSPAILSRSIVALAITEAFLIIMLLPMSFLHKTALFTIVFAFSFELAHTYLAGGLGRKKLLTISSCCIAFSVITLTAVEWSVR